jgi:hypothetical protein
MEFIYTNKSLKKDNCDKIIEYFENENSLKYQGVTFGGLDKRIKDTVDIIIPNKSETENKWNEINDILSDELEKNLKPAINKIQKINIFRDLLHEYELNFSNYIQNGHLDSLQKIKAKQIYDYNLGKSCNYPQLIN